MSLSDDAFCGNFTEVLLEGTHTKVSYPKKRRREKINVSNYTHQNFVRDAIRGLNT